MASRQKRLDPVARLAHNHEQKAARALGECQRELSESERRLAELEQYLDEYTRQFQSRAQAGLDGNRLAEYRAFLSRLDEAVAYQREVVANQRQAVESQRAQWAQRSSHAKALDKVIGRSRAREQAAAEGREQAEGDEHAQHPARRNGSGT